jgi:hypothetical protein
MIVIEVTIVAERHDILVTEREGDGRKLCNLSLLLRVKVTKGLAVCGKQFV